MDQIPHHTYDIKSNRTEAELALELRRLAAMLEAGRAKLGTGGLFILRTENSGIRILGDMTLLTA